MGAVCRGGGSAWPRFADSPDVAQLAAIWSSAETKAVEAAAILADPLGLSPGVEEDLHENDQRRDRLPAPAGVRKQVANAFFASPEESIRGLGARHRCAGAGWVAAVERVLATSPEGERRHRGSRRSRHAAALLSCSASRLERSHDQPFQGHVFRLRESEPPRAARLAAHRPALTSSAQSARCL